jgi:hypothetical protein
VRFFAVNRNRGFEISHAVSVRLRFKKTFLVKPRLLKNDTAQGSSGDEELRRCAVN